MISPGESSGRATEEDSGEAEVSREKSCVKTVIEGWIDADWGLAESTMDEAANSESESSEEVAKDAPKHDDMELSMEEDIREVGNVVLDEAGGSTEVDIRETAMGLDIVEWSMDVEIGDIALDDDKVVESNEVETVDPVLELDKAGGSTEVDIRERVVDIDIVEDTGDEAIDLDKVGGSTEVEMRGTVIDPEIGVEGEVSMDVETEETAGDLDEAVDSMVEDDDTATELAIGAESKTVPGRSLLISGAEVSQGNSPARRKPLEIISGLVKVFSVAWRKSQIMEYLLSALPELQGSTCQFQTKFFNSFFRDEKRVKSKG